MPIPTPSDDIYSILLLGYPGGKHDGAFLTDTILTVSINKTKKIASLISIPRDLWVERPDKKGTFAKINTLYQLERFNKNKKQHDPTSDSELIKRTISQITGFPVTKVVIVNFDGFIQAIDNLGGITVNVEKSFEDKEFPIAGKEADTCGKEGEELEKALEEFKDKPRQSFPCRFEIATFSAGIKTMDGDTALKYVRSRHGAGEQGDFARAKRQQLILEALSKKLLNPSILPKIPSLFETLSLYVQTDLTPLDITSLLSQAPHKDDYKVYTVSPDIDNVLKYDYSDDGQYILIPQKGKNKWEEVKFYIHSSIGPPPSPSPRLSPTRAIRVIDLKE